MRSDCDIPLFFCVVTLTNAASLLVPFNSGRTYTLYDFCQRRADGSCLVLSPADFWQHNRTLLELDQDILATISHGLFPTYSDEMVSTKGMKNRQGTDLL